MIKCIDCKFHSTGPYGFIHYCNATVGTYQDPVFGEEKDNFNFCKIINCHFDCQYFQPKPPKPPSIFSRLVTWLKGKK